jgi:hypothetical protein
MVSTTPNEYLLVLRPTLMGERERWDLPSAVCPLLLDPLPAQAER